MLDKREYQDKDAEMNLAAFLRQGQQLSFNHQWHGNCLFFCLERTSKHNIITFIGTFHNFPSLRFRPAFSRMLEKVYCF